MVINIYIYHTHIWVLICVDQQSGITPCKWLVLGYNRLSILM